MTVMSVDDVTDALLMYIGDRDKINCAQDQGASLFGLGVWFSCSGLFPS